jgi:hypothetical protein
VSYVDVRTSVGRTLLLSWVEWGAKRAAPAGQEGWTEGDRLRVEPDVLKDRFGATVLDAPGLVVLSKLLASNRIRYNVVIP